MKNSSFHWLKDPLAQFLLLGLIVFSANSIYNQKKPPIIIKAEHQRNFSAHFHGTYVKTPNQESTNNLIQQEIINEVLYQEGLQYGLEKGDHVIRKRIIQKMNFM